MISVQDVTDQVETRGILERAQAEQKDLLGELQRTNRRLSDINKDLQDANEELQATNEELMLAQEELQATNEEFEATNEELQATNEELETNNEELQATNEELETTNEELNARSQEMQELTRILADERTWLSEMVEYAPLSMLVLRGPKLVVEAFNSGYERIFEEGGALGSPAAVIFDLPEMLPLLEMIQSAAERDKTDTIRLLVPQSPQADVASENIVDYTAVPIHDSTGQVTGVIVYANDVTEQVEREAEVRREQLKLMVEHADQVALGLYDAKSTELLQASPRYLEALERMHGYASGSIIGRRFKELAFADTPESFERVFHEAVADGQSRRLGEVRQASTAEREETVWDVTLIPITEGEGDENSGVRFVAFSAIEMTEQARVREELQRLNTMRDIFLSTASHELRTPLVPIVAYADLITRIIRRNGEEWDPRLGEYVGRIKEQAVQLTRLTEDLFDAGRIETGKFTLKSERVDLCEVLRGAAEEARTFNQEHNIRLHLPGDDEETACHVHGDKMRLTQVVVNLLHNAMKYAGGRKDIDLSIQMERGKGVIEVRDYGVGIAGEDLPHLFTRFFQGRNRETHSKDGLGLGLYISKSIIEQHGGEIEVESTLGEGTHFTITLPAAGDEESGEGDGEAKVGVEKTPRKRSRQTSSR